METTSFKIVIHTTLRRGVPILEDIIQQQQQYGLVNCYKYLIPKIQAKPDVLPWL